MEQSSSEKVRYRIIFDGRVQGVGFRYTARETANMLGLTGWVCNQYDGTVLMEVQGRRETIEKMILSLERAPFIEIMSAQKKEIPLSEYDIYFEVRYD